jgi:hypothetical protein
VEAAEARHPAAVRRFRRGRRDDLVLAIGVKATNASELARLTRDDAGDRRALPQGPDAHAALAGRQGRAPAVKAEHLGWFANYIDEFTDPEYYARLVREIERKRPGSARLMGVDPHHRTYRTNRYYTPKRARV